MRASHTISVQKDSMRGRGFGKRENREDFRSAVRLQIRQLSRTIYYKKKTELQVQLEAEDGLDNRVVAAPRTQEKNNTPKVRACCHFKL